MSYRRRLANCGGGFDVDAKSEKLASLEEAAAVPGFWDDASAAQTVMRDITKLRNQVGIWEKLSDTLAETRELVELEDEDLAAELGRDVDQPRNLAKSVTVE